MAEFTAEVFQNEYLPDGATDVHAIVAVTCTGAGTAGQTGAGEAAEIVIIDSSGSMAYPMAKIRSAREAGQVALNHIVDGTWFAVIAGTDRATLVYPVQPGAVSMVRMSPQTRAQAQGVIARFEPQGGTAIGRWLELARTVFDGSPAAQQHALLLTDGRDESETTAEFHAAVEKCKGVFQCDTRGVGADWTVDELRYVAGNLLGSVDLIADPANMAADFAKIMEDAMSRGVGDVSLQLWAPQGAQILFVRQVSPSIDDLTPRRVEAGPLLGNYPTGAWGDGTREYHVSVRVPAKGAGSEQLAARMKLLVGGEVVSQGLVKAIWSDDDALTTRINPAVAHYTGQTELAAAIQEGLAAKAAGDEETATSKLGRAVQLAVETGNEDATSRLRKIVEVDDAETGTVRLKKQVDKLDEMALDTSSTKTTRVR